MPNDGRLIVYVDDLDRCTPKNAVEIIEAVNLFVNSDKCVFVLGMDHTILGESINIKYRQMSRYFRRMATKRRSEKPENKEVREIETLKKYNYGEHFLEKIIQIPFAMPTLSENEINSLGNSVLGSNVKGKTDHKSNEQKDPATKEADLPKSMQLREEIIQFARQLLTYIEANPRSIKRFLNLVRFVHFLRYENRDRFDKIQDVALTFWVFLHYLFPDEVATFRETKCDLTWAEIKNGCNQTCQEIKRFFSAYNEQHGDAGLNTTGQLEGSLSQYCDLTRCLSL